MTVAPHGVTLSFEYGSERRARIVERSVAPEVGEIDDDRSSTRIDRGGREVVVGIEADDLVALRAAINTWLSLLSVAERTAADGRPRRT